MRRKGPCDCLTEERESGFDCNVPFSRRRLPIFGVSPGGASLSISLSFFISSLPRTNNMLNSRVSIQYIFSIRSPDILLFHFRFLPQLPCSSSILMTKTRGLVFMPIAVCCLGLPFSRQTGGQWRPIICFLIAVLTARASDGVK